MTIKIYALDVCDWWAGESLIACITEARKHCGADCYEDAEEDGVELTDADMLSHKFYDEDGDAANPYISFAQQLAEEIASGTVFPSLFASTEC